MISKLLLEKLQESEELKNQDTRLQKQLQSIARDSLYPLDGRVTGDRLKAIKAMKNWLNSEYNWYGPLTPYEFDVESMNAIIRAELEHDNP